MPEFIGRIQIPEIAPVGTFPLKAMYGTGVAIEPKIITHQFGSANAKIEQRFILGEGVRTFHVRSGFLSQADLDSLLTFWEARKGAYQPFTYVDPTGTSYTVRFKDPSITFEYVRDCVATVGITLVEVPSATPAYNITQTCTRFPNETLNNALADQVQQIVPLIRIRVRESEVSDIYLSDRRVSVGGNVYQPRLLGWDGIGQSVDGSSDQASFVFGNADRVITQLVNDTELWRATIEFSLFHIGTQTKLDVWKGEVKDWSFDSGTEFRVQASDGIYELTLPYPARRIARTCWKQFNDGNNCPFATQGTGSFTSCGKDFASCSDRGMANYFGGIIAKPQAVRTKDNSTGNWGFGRSPLTSTSQVADSIYSEIVPEIYHDNPAKPLPVNCKIVSGRDEGDFYNALGIIGEGPIKSFQTNTVAGQQTYHKLDGQPAHGPGTLGLRLSVGNDPNPDPFSLGEGGHGKPQTYGPERAAGTAFIELRRKDDKGLQLSRLSEHQLEAYVAQGLSGWTWSGPGARSEQKQLLTNPVWIAVNCILRAKGLFQAAAEVQEELFDVEQAVAAAAICDTVVPAIIPGSQRTWVPADPTYEDEDGKILLTPKPGQWETVEVTQEKQFKFSGMLREEKPLRDWIQEILANCLGYYTFTFGKLKLGTRFHSGSQSAFTEGNILFGSLELSALTPTFNHMTANFADEEYDYISNSVVLYDSDHAQKIGGATSPLYLKSQINLSGTSTKSQAARIITARLREELGGISADEQKKARKYAFRTTVLAMEVDPGMVCSLDHPDLPDEHGEFRVLSWKLNHDYTIDIQGQTTTDSMYDMIVGDKPVDVIADPLPVEEQFAPDDFGFYLDVHDGKITFKDWFCKVNPTTVHQAKIDLYYVPEDRVDLCAMTSFADNGDGTATVGYRGDVPVVGEWIYIDGELLEVLSVTATECVAKRAQVATQLMDHARVSATPSGYEDNLAVLTVSGDFKPGNLITTDPGAEWNIISDVSDGKVEVMRPFEDLDGQAIYSDPRIYRVIRKSIVIPFAPRFFVSAARASFTHTIDLPNAGLVAFDAVLENTRGIRSYVWGNQLMPNFPYRWRTSGNNGIALTYPHVPAGFTQDAFNPVRVPAAQSWDGANADLTLDGGPIMTPAAVTSVSPGPAQATGTITIGGTIDGQIGIIISGLRNHVSVPVFTITEETTANAVSSSLTDWLNNQEEFASFYSAAAQNNIVSITDKTGLGGKLSSSCSGGITAAVTGLTNTLGVKYGRKYAVSFKGAEYESALSPASPASGPTGGAASVLLAGIPVSEDGRVTTVRIWAAPDGQDSPFRLVGTVDNGTTEYSDSVTEDALAEAAVFPGAVQPEGANATITVKKDGWPWFQLRIVDGKSNKIHPFALGATPEGTTITADVDCGVSDADLRVFID